MSCREVLGHRTGMRFQKIAAAWNDRPLIVKLVVAGLTAWFLASMWMWNSTREFDDRAGQAVLDSWAADLDSSLETATLLEQQFADSGLESDPYFTTDTYSRYLEIVERDTSSAISDSKDEVATYSPPAHLLDSTAKKFDERAERFARASVIAEVLSIVRDECSGVQDPWHESVQLVGATVVEHHSAVRSIATNYCEVV